jgi:gluconokinase
VRRRLSSHARSSATLASVGPFADIVMGVSGAGKTTIGQALARRMHWPFLDADDLHSATNVAKMTRGEPLTDADRGPWLDAVHARISDALGRNTSIVVACSALKQTYRDHLTGGDPRVVLVHLDAPRDVLAARLASRRGHFAAPSLLDSQLASLEPPGDDALVVDATRTPDESVAGIVARLPTTPLRP